MPETNNGTKLLPVLIGTAFAFVILASAALLWRGSAHPGSAELRTLSALASASQSIPLQADMALRGDAAAFDALDAARHNLEGIAAQTTAVAQQLQARDELLKKSGVVLESRPAVLAAVDMDAAIKKFVPSLLQTVGTLASGFGASRVEALSRPLERIESTGHRLEQDAAAFAQNIADTKAAGQRLGDGIDYIGQVLGELAGQESGLGLPKVSGADGEQKLKALTAAYRSVSDKVRASLAMADRISAAHDANAALPAAAEAVVESLHPAGADTPPASKLETLLQSWLPWTFLSLAALTLLGAVFAIRYVTRLRLSAEKQRAANDRNQDAILRLLDELSNLADGDLTVQATVTEDITGAIADSINYAIEALRELVGTINETAITLDAATKQTLANAAHLAKASVAQSKQAASASESIAAMAGSVEEVSGNAERSADVARHSVDIAHKGGDAVRRTIDGMNAIRETIQETSKRIKRLGESSQEIGNIVELINDIAEQTNILALNASIQASMAGEAGRGFAVVADEVQRLAERAANATKQIEVLVRAIQADTNEAVVSMERSTTDVVGGALLAENAGAALEEIEQVSNQIASLVQNISASARHQTTAAQSVSRTMQTLREISATSAENTSATSNSIGKLAELSAQLRKSVAGFRLPAATANAAQSQRGAPAKAGKLQAAGAAEDSGVRKVSGLKV